MVEMTTNDKINKMLVILKLEITEHYIEVSQ